MMHNILTAIVGVSVLLFAGDASADEPTRAYMVQLMESLEGSGYHPNDRWPHGIRDEEDCESNCHGLLSHVEAVTIRDEKYHGQWVAQEVHVYRYVNESARDAARKKFDGLPWGPYAKRPYSMRNVGDTMIVSIEGRARFPKFRRELRDVVWKNADELASRLPKQRVAAEKQQADATERATDVGGRLCIKRPVIGQEVGKGRSSPGTTREELQARAKKLSGGFRFELSEKVTMVTPGDGGVIEGLKTGERHRVVVRTDSGDRHSTFTVKLTEEEPAVCARYDSFYDNWRLRPWSGRSDCGGCTSTP